MPIYEYRCPACGGTSEIWEGVGTRRDSLECKHCGDRNLEKILSLSHPVKNPRPKGSTCCGREEGVAPPSAPPGALAARVRKGGLKEAGDFAEDLAAAMLASTLGIEFDANKSWDEKKEFYRLSDRIVRTTNITQSAIGKNGWTTVIAAGIFLL